MSFQKPVRSRASALDELGAEAIDQSIGLKLVAAAIWAQRCEPEGRYVGTEFGEVGSVRLAFDGLRTVGMLQVKSLMDSMQDTIQGTLAQSHDSVLAWLEQLAADTVLEVTKKNIAHWNTVPAGGLACTPARSEPLSAIASAIGCQHSVLLNGIGAENLGLLSALHKQSGMHRWAEYCDAGCKFAAM